MLTNNLTMPGRRVRLARVAGWIYRKHSPLSRNELRRRFCRPGSWKIAHKGVGLVGASSVAVTRYRYRGNVIPTPWTPSQVAAASNG